MSNFKGFAMVEVLLALMLISALLGGMYEIFLRLTLREQSSQQRVVMDEQFVMITNALYRTNCKLTSWLDQLVCDQVTDELAGAEIVLKNSGSSCVNIKIEWRSNAVERKFCCR